MTATASSSSCLLQPTTNAEQQASPPPPPQGPSSASLLSPGRERERRDQHHHTASFKVVGKQAKQHSTTNLTQQSPLRSQVDCLGFISQEEKEDRRKFSKCPLSRQRSSPCAEEATSFARGRRRRKEQDQDKDKDRSVKSIDQSGNEKRRRKMGLEGYAWSPPGLNANQTEAWMRQLPEEKVPRVESDGEKYRELQLVYQMPKQDLRREHCHHLDSAPSLRDFEDFASARDDVAIDTARPVIVGDKAGGGRPCPKCSKEVEKGSMAVVAPRIGLSSAWHPSCFTCSTCEELLVDLTYCVWDGKVFCERHYAENLKPRCGACDELIFSGQYTKAISKDWHCHHFCCWKCDEVLTGREYVLLNSDRPCCVTCYEGNFAHDCQRCRQRIGLGSKDMAYKDMHWHEDCFACHKCKASLVEKPFAAKNAFIFCGTCYDTEFASRCDACGDTFRPGMKKMEYKNRKWHDKCFQCSVCKSAVGSKPFIIPNDTDVYCVGCFEEKFATKCTKCKKVMTSGGVTFKSEAWHRECFTCANCSCMLAGQKFASRGDQPYCAACFGDLFAKRCTACSKPITGTGGTRFISFEGRHWHSQCFVCALCSVSMAGKGFITDGEDIICPECAKEKLMGGGTGSSNA